MGSRWLSRVRSALYVPADRPDAMAKAHLRGADALILDLEDGVAAGAAKERARSALQAQLAAPRPGDVPVLVRVNAEYAEQARDFAALADRAPDGIVVPKVDGPGDPAQAHEHAQAALGAAADGLVYVALVESVRGLMDLTATLAGPARLDGLALGGEDFAADLGVERSAAGLELQFPRAWVAAWARAHGLAALDTPHLDLDDDDGLAAEARAAAQVGFTGKLLVHPRQIAIVHAALAPSEAQLARARRVLDAAALAGAGGPGVVVVDGRMVDAPVVRQAQATLTRATTTTKEEVS